MKTRNLQFLSVLLAAMMMTACSDEINGLFGSDGDSIPVEVTASFKDGDLVAATRGADNLNYSSSGFSLLTSSNSNSKVRVMADNGSGTYSQYDYSITGSTTISAPSTPPRFPSGVTTVHVYGWYPNVSLSGFSVKTDQSSNADYCLSDLMVATNSNCVRTISNGSSSITSNAALSFNHVMSKAKVVLTLASGVTVTSVKLKSIKKTVTVSETKSSNQVTGFSLGSASSANDITLYSGTMTSSQTVCGVFPPQSKSGNLLEIQASYNNGSTQTITYSLGSSSKTFQKGYYYTFNISLNAQNVTTSTIDISNWNIESGTVDISTGPDGPTLSPTSLTLYYYGATGSITPSLSGASAFSGLSSNTGVATVSGTSSITVTPLAKGTANITIFPTNKTGEFSSTICPVTVSALPFQTSNSSNYGYVTIANIPDQLYTGSAITPTPAVTIKRRDNSAATLTNNTDFTYSYSNNTNAGTNTATVTVTAKSSGNYTGSASKTFTITTVPVVDLGLSVKWAAYNVGATSETGYGSYFAWGGTTDVSNVNTGWNSNCPYWNSGSEAYDLEFTKYVRTGEDENWGGSGSPDNKTILELSDDAARANLGGSWRMPTKEEWEELKSTNNCTWTWYDNYNSSGIAGYKVTSKKSGYAGNSIFLPAAGCREGSSFDSQGSYGNYWSSSIGEGSTIAWELYLRPAGVSVMGYGRFVGYSVRAVQSNGVSLANSVVGDVVASDGLCYAPGNFPSNKTKVAVVGYKNGSSGYAIALVDASRQAWNDIISSGANDTNCVLADDKRGNVPAAPTGMNWYVLTSTNYCHLWEAMGSANTYNNASNRLITAAGGTELTGTYWTTTSSDFSCAYAFYSGGMPGGSVKKSGNQNVRPALAW